MLYLSFVALALGPAAPQRPPEIIVSMAPCDLQRSVTGMFMKTSKHLVLEGDVVVGNETFKIYLPEDKDGYSLAPRPKRKGILTHFTSTCLAIDQNHDGKLDTWESTYAENPVRIGDAMFTLVSIDEDGTLTLRPSGGPLYGPVLGRKAPDFEWTTIDGSTITRDDFLGKAVVLDVWAPS